MRKGLYTVGFLVAALELCVAHQGGNSTQAVQGNGNCHYYTPQELSTRHCHESTRNQDQGAFKDLYTSMNNAREQEHAAAFLIYTTTWMYRYIHCCSDTEAIASLYYGVREEELPSNKSNFWQTAYDYLHQSAVPLVGRRRREIMQGGPLTTTGPDDVLLLQQLKNIARDTSPSCIQWLISHFNDTASRYFRHNNPHFPNPHHFRPESGATPAATGDTTPPASSSGPVAPQATTSTTTTQLAASPSATQPAASPSATQPATSPSAAQTIAAAASTSPSNLKCFECSGLRCLIGEESETVVPCGSDKDFCMVSMYEGPHGRDINRTCASENHCRAQINQNDANCDLVEDQELDWFATCTYCCIGERCNHPPHIKPEDSTLWHPSR